MDKKRILNNFGEDDKADVLNLYEKYTLSFERDIPIFGNNFYSPNVWKFFQSTLGTKEFKVETYGFFKEAERRMISFNNLYDAEFPIKVIKIENNSKFSSPTHRDYLGAILSLGINRNKIGDLLIKDNICYLPICEEIEDFIINNLTSIGRSPCSVTTVEEGFIPPNPEFKEEIILVQSLRVDSIVAKLTKLSRGKSQAIIEEGKVLIDYNRIKDKSKEVVKGERITIRGLGKFILGDIVGSSKSGKFKVVIKKYT
ncbi:RNA-binding protein [Clostridium sp. LP20]|uniref:YlmH family RNA-binding protein n=1 Tax=Clostridium sp. LP20 TaxID=3418665 RepID=UPI003EE6C9F5